MEKGYYPYEELSHGLPGTELLHFRGFTKPGEGPFVPFVLEPNRRRTGRDGTDYPRQTYELGALKKGQDPWGPATPPPTTPWGPKGFWSFAFPGGCSSSPTRAAPPPGTPPNPSP